MQNSTISSLRTRFPWHSRRLKLEQSLLAISGRMGILVILLDGWRVYEWRALAEARRRWDAESLRNGTRLSHDKVLPSVVIPMSLNIIHQFQKTLTRETHKKFYRAWLVGPPRSTSYGTMEVLTKNRSHPEEQIDMHPNCIVFLWGASIDLLDRISARGKRCFLGSFYGILIPNQILGCGAKKQVEDLPLIELSSKF